MAVLVNPRKTWLIVRESQYDVAGRWTFLLRTVPDIEPLLLPLEEAIHRHLITALTGRETCDPAERELLSMPVRLGGLGIIDPSKQASHEFSTSTKVSASLVALIMAQDTCYAAKRAIQVQRIEELKENFHPALNSLGPKFTRVLAALIKFILRFRAASSA